MIKLDEVIIISNLGNLLSAYLVLKKNKIAGILKSFSENVCETTYLIWPYFDESVNISTRAVWGGF